MCRSPSAPPLATASSPTVTRPSEPTLDSEKLPLSRASKGSVGREAAATWAVAETVPAVVRAASSVDGVPAFAAQPDRPCARSCFDDSPEHCEYQSGDRAQGQELKPARARVAPGSEGMNERHGPGGVGEPVHGAPGPIPKPRSQQARDDHREQEVERDRAEADPDRAVARDERDDGVAQADRRVAIEDRR